MKVVEMFSSIDGEGLFSGMLATFIRLAGCNLRCKYCDTCYALKMEDGSDASIDEILRYVEIAGNKHITITGGEPLIHDQVIELIKRLCDRGYLVNIETNGSIPIDERLLSRENVFITMDYKLGCSGENGKMHVENLALLRKGHDALKFVATRDDADEIHDVITRFHPTCDIYLSPVFGQCDPIELIGIMRELATCGDTECEKVAKEQMRIQLQLHKLVWDPSQRGV